MKHQIISNAGDVSALLRNVTGRYELPPNYRWGYAAIAGFLGVFAFHLARKVATWSPATGDDRSALLIGLGSTLLFACIFVVRATTSYSFTPRTIARESPIPFWRRQLAVEEIHEGWLHVGQGIALELIAASGARMSIPLEAQLRSDLARLYPEVGHDAQFSSPVASARYRKVIWIVVAVLVLSVVALAIVLTNAGLTSW
jgi:hypothetical protein